MKYEYLVLYEKFAFYINLEGAYSVNDAAIC